MSSVPLQSHPSFKGLQVSRLLFRALPCHPHPGETLSPSEQCSAFLTRDFCEGVSLRSLCFSPSFGFCTSHSIPSWCGCGGHPCDAHVTFPAWLPCVPGGLLVWPGAPFRGFRHPLAVLTHSSLRVLPFKFKSSPWQGEPATGFALSPSHLRFPPHTHSSFLALQHLEGRSVWVIFFSFTCH